MYLKDIIVISTFYCIDSDYISVNQILTFRSNKSSEQCITFSASSDDLVEGEETLLVALSDANFVNVTLDPDEAIIRIIDTTGI